VTYPEAIQYLYSLRLFGAKLGLENTFKLATLCGNPQQKLRFIHVAGTNGKGSTCAMLESIYRTAGLRVGLFTSPHLVSFRERIQIERELISEADVVQLVEKFQKLLVQFPKEQHPTFFEVITVMALDFFAARECELVVWETGLGGRLDATNIVTPLASVITNIGFDHQQWLGDTLEKIAFEKAGIIKPGIPAVTATDEPGALAVIKKIAEEKGAPLTMVADKNLPAEFAAPLEKALPGEHQKHNAALALATVKILQKEIPVSATQIQVGLQNVSWPGRMQLIEKPDGRRFLLDGAHNIAGAKVLNDSVEKNFQPADRTLILGILGDKDWKYICEMLAPVANNILAVPVASQRTANPMELAEVCRAANPSAKVVVCGSLNEALEQTSTAGFTIITGSLYLVGEALELLGFYAPATHERELNEWNTKPSVAA
jgi:dihydrofolate synthase/folylpolyglutamate synthase